MNKTVMPEEIKKRFRARKKRNPMLTVWAMFDGEDWYVYANSPKNAERRMASAPWGCEVFEKIPETNNEELFIPVFKTITEAPKLAAVPIYESNFRDISKTLRQIADEIDAGGYPGINQLAMVTHGETVCVFNLGNGSANDAHLLLALGQRKLENAVLFPESS